MVGAVIEMGADDCFVVLLFGPGRDHRAASPPVP
jgi:hypothetical protein